MTPHSLHRPAVGGAFRLFGKTAVLAHIPTDRLGNILDIAEDGIITINARHEIVLFNRGASKLFGYEPEEAAGRPLALLIPERFHARHGDQINEFGRSADQARPMGARREVWGRRKDGSEFPAEISISKLLADGEVWFTAIIRDVTERKQHEAVAQELEQLRTRARIADAEAAARKTETQFRRIVETANEGIWELDAEARIVFVNDRMAELLGYTTAEVQGRFKWDFLFEEDQEAVHELFERRKQGVSERADMRFRRRDGEAVWTLMSARPLFGEQGEFRGALDMFTDITDRRRAEESLRETTRQLWQAARLAGVGELAASIAHELNNPLGTVALRIERLLAKSPAEDPKRRSL
ncbi:MAG TPA: PAS domain S-box protein, partial [Pirellulales bacterium]